MRVAVLPYLRVKHEQAHLGLEFRKYVGHSRGQLTEEVARIRTEIANSVRVLNDKHGKGTGRLVHEGVS